MLLGSWWYHRLSDQRSSDSDSELVVHENGLVFEQLGYVTTSVFGDALPGDIYSVLVFAENHRTDTEYEDSLITKVCLFQFINSYIALFYVAFVKGSVRIFGKLQQCDGNDCLAELFVFGCVWWYSVGGC